MYQQINMCLMEMLLELGQFRGLLDIHKMTDFTVALTSDRENISSYSKFENLLLSLDFLLCFNLLLMLFTILKCCVGICLISLFMSLKSEMYLCPGLDFIDHTWHELQFSAVTQIPLILNSIDQLPPVQYSSQVY